MQANHHFYPVNNAPLSMDADSDEVARYPCHSFWRWAIQHNDKDGDCNVQRDPCRICGSIDAGVCKRTPWPSDALGAKEKLEAGEHCKSCAR